MLLTFGRLSDTSIFFGLPLQALYMDIINHTCTFTVSVTISGDVS